MAKRIVSWERKRKRLGYFFILPFIIGAVFFLLIPLITSLRYSFSNLTVNSTGTGYDLAFVGIQNYYQLLAVDPTYRQVLLEAIWNMIINVPIAVVFSFFIASILNQKFRGRGLVRGIFFLPVLLSSGIYLRLASVDQMTNMMQQGVDMTVRIANALNATTDQLLAHEFSRPEEIYLKEIAERIEKYPVSKRILACEGFNTYLDSLEKFSKS